MAHGNLNVIPKNQPQERVRMAVRRDGSLVVVTKRRTEDKSLSTGSALVRLKIRDTQNNE